MIDSSIPKYIRILLRYPILPFYAALHPRLAVVREEYYRQQQKRISERPIRTKQFHLLLNPDDRVISPVLDVYGVWEKMETEIFKGIVRSGDTVVDVGANIGYYTVIASKLVGDSGMVYAFEPEPRNFEILLKNIKLNNCTNVLATQKALSDHAGKSKLYLSDRNMGDHSLTDRSSGERKSIDVELATLDDLFESAGKKNKRYKN